MTVNTNKAHSTETTTTTDTIVVPGFFGRMIDSIVSNRKTISLGLVGAAAAGAAGYVAYNQYKKTDGHMGEIDTASLGDVVDIAGALATLPIREIVSRLIC
jgi:hypothetical protein